MNRYMFLGFRGSLTDSLFVARLGHLGAGRAALVKQLLKEVAIPILVENQFALGWRLIGLCGIDVEESGSRVVRAPNFHDLQISVVDHLDHVLARRKFGVSDVEREWDVAFKVSTDLRVR